MIDTQTRYQLGDLRLMDKYEIIIYWSADDGAFIAEVHELPGCMAHEASHEAALGNIKTAIELWIQTAEEFNDPIPQQKGRRLVYA
jgi:predicted RNase H-like HicB family nuclease